MSAASRGELAMRRTAILVILAVLATALLSGCVRRSTLYAWGSYEDQVYAMYSETGKVQPEKQIESLESDYQAARSENKPVPPGFHAYLGYLYFQTGKVDQAYQSFQTEKQLFPESARYMDLLISHMTHT